MTTAEIVATIYRDPDQIRFLAFHEHENGTMFVFQEAETTNAMLIYEFKDRKWSGLIIPVVTDEEYPESFAATRGQLTALLSALPSGWSDYITARPEDRNAWGFTLDYGFDGMTLRNFAKRIAAKAA